jgi:hypothetical protein
LLLCCVNATDQQAKIFKLSYVKVPMLKAISTDV